MKNKFIIVGRSRNAEQKTTNALFVQNIQIIAMTKRNKSLLCILCGIVVLIVSCSPPTKTTRILTPGEVAIGVVGSSQPEAFWLMETHRPLATLVVSSEYEARQRAVRLKAEIIQLIHRKEIVKKQSRYGYSFPVSKTEITYRFWIRRESITEEELKQNSSG